MAAHRAMSLVPKALERAGLAHGKQVLRMQDEAERIRRAAEKNRTAIGEDAVEDLPEEGVQVAASVEANPERKPSAPKQIVVSGDNPYRATSNYGVLFALGSQRFWKREELLAEAAKAVGKEAKLVRNDLAVLMNPAHASNKGRSVAERDAEGNVKLARV